MEDQETLKTGAVVGDAADLVQNLIDELLSNSVVSTRVIVGRILLASNHLFRVEKASVGASADFVDDIGLEVTVDGPRNIFALACDEYQSSDYYLKRMSLDGPVSEKKVLKPWSSAASALRSSVRYPSGWRGFH